MNRFLLNRCAHWLRRLKDELLHCQPVRELVARLIAHPLQGPERMTRAYELTTHCDLQRAISMRLQQTGAFEDSDLWLQHAATSPRYQAAYRHRPQLGRSIVLKAPSSGGERGVLLMTFEYNWAKLMLATDAEQRRWLDDHYHLVLSTSWSPTDYSMLAMMLANTRNRLWVQACNPGERQAIEAFHPRLSALLTMPCDWLDPDGFDPQPAGQRDIDLLMVANWGDFKRHWELFDLLNDLPKDWRVVLVGQSAQGRHRLWVQRLAREYGVRQPLEIHESLPVTEVASLQARSRVALILSRREGCCVAAVEAMMAGAALAMREDAHVGPLAYINAQTGARLRIGHLAADLQDLHSSSAQKQPREWCLKHANNQRSIALLEQQLRDHDLALGLPWTQGLALPMWKPHPVFARADQRQHLKPAYEELCQRLPAAVDMRLWEQPAL